MKRLAELLQAPRRPGFPADFLLARLPNRRAMRATSCPAGSGEEARRERDRERGWLYGRLEPELRRDLAPVLLFFELPALLAALRFAAAGDRCGAGACLRAGHLAPELQRILTSESVFPERLRRLGELLAAYDPGLAGLEATWRQLGLPGLELALDAGLLAAARREQPAGPIRDFLDRLAERRELLRLVKAERWQRRLPAARAPRRALLHRSLSPAAAGDPAALDRLLRAEQTREWQRRGRSGGPLERLLDYLWVCEQSARDCGVRSLENLLGETRVKAETVL